MTTGTLSSVETYSNFDFRLLDLMILIKIWFESDHLVSLFWQEWELSFNCDFKFFGIKLKLFAFDNVILFV